MESLTQDQPRILAACNACGGDPGGLLFEGLILTGMLTADDIVALLHGAVDRRAVVRLFTKGVLRGRKIGKTWVIRASVFVADWAELESRPRSPARMARKPLIVEVARRVR